jgi:predicted nucleotidyltransferase
VRRDRFLDLAQDRRDYKIRLAEAVRKVTPEEVQHIQAAMTGKVHGIQTVGDIARSMNIELMIVATVISNNIQRHEILSFKENWR